MPTLRARILRPGALQSSALRSGPAAWLVAASLALAASATDGTPGASGEADAATYDLHWGILPVAEGRLFVRAEPAATEAWLDVHTGPALRWIYDLDYHGEARLGERLEPRTSRFIRTRNRRIKVVAMDFGPDGVDVFERSRRPGREEKIRRERVPPESGLLDPFALLLRLRAEPWEPNQQRSYLVQSGRDRWRVTLRCRGREEIAWAGGTRPAWVLEADAEEQLAEPEDETGHGEDAEQPWVAEVLAFVADDGGGDLLELRVVTRIGDVRARLRPPTVANAAR